MSARYISDPFSLGPPLVRAGTGLRREGLAETEDFQTHVRDRIMAVLFTRPAERVMRPRFGAGLDAQVFQNISPLALSALEYRIRESLDAVFGDEVLLEDLTVTGAEDEGAILVTIDYALRRDRSPLRLEVVL
ncbi:GPW/gp25 family protein [Paracoccus sp. CPCC 101403]|uniref:GPW/gp25 family protein n=1 Tax=Paracoccus broussonetiae TaxID=3075834 RepID=A0ABU3ECN7_9RHOB|nr:GPW/gp25 family protein [Paracoccus sp. CPCC 101403]MDT1061991.1 GPW/gp25 family protein [Paracoccus sp. CPCC 101403]